MCCSTLNLLLLNCNKLLKLFSIFGKLHEQQCTISFSILRVNMNDLYFLFPENRFIQIETLCRAIFNNYRFSAHAFADLKHRNKIAKLNSDWEIYRDQCVVAFNIQ